MGNEDQKVTDVENLMDESEDTKDNMLLKLLHIQQELKAPKGQYNDYGNYNYRSCEDILVAVKPLLNKYELVIKLIDEIVQIGDRYYLKATARLLDQNYNFIENIAYAREDESKKGMDGAQITGTASSYARKYALNGLFAIDDNKDADTNEYKQEQGEKKPSEIPATERQIARVKKIAKDMERELSDEWLASLTMTKASEFIKTYGGK